MGTTIRYKMQQAVQKLLYGGDRPLDIAEAKDICEALGISNEIDRLCIKYEDRSTYKRIFGTRFTPDNSSSYPGKAMRTLPLAHYIHSELGLKEPGPLFVDNDIQLRAYAVAIKNHLNALLEWDITEESLRS